MLRLFLISCVFLSFAAIAEENATIKVKAGKFLYKTDLPGLILSSEVEKIKIDAKQWQNWVLVKAATHGQFVKKGDVLALFESKEYEEALEAGKRNLETQKANLLKSQTLFEISMKKMDFEKKKAQLDAEAAQKLAMIYKEKGHAQAKANFEQDLIDAQNSLEYQKEELSQLKKMYDEDKVFNEYGIHPKNFLLFRMFDGDKSDGIPGVNGIGKKTLIKLFPFMETEDKYTLDDIYRSAETQKVPMCEKILQSKDLLDMNKTLMDLEDGIISGQQKLKVKEIVERPIQRLIKHRFQTMFLEDKMYQALPNLNSWLATTFNRMNHIAQESHK